MENHIAKGKAKWVIGRSPPTVSGENVFISFILKKKKKIKFITPRNPENGRY